MNNDNKVETEIAGLTCWASYPTDSFYDDISMQTWSGNTKLIYF